ncbi:MAG: hypothetical protein KC964_11500 [Candidatus Omnitrophica bacterium]|nr:hypothetical protein [Candidatus Omnitrophota bacterium]
MTLRRREFLSLGCAGAVSWPFIPLSRASEEVFQQGPFELSLGFIQSPKPSHNSDASIPPAFSGIDLDQLGEDSIGSTPILDPRIFLTGDVEFLRRDARLTVQGGFGLPGAFSDSGIEELSIEVDYAPFQPVRFTAWHFGNREVVNQGSTNSFTVPVSPEQGLNLYTQIKSGGQSIEFRSQFLTGSVIRSIKLKRGLYLLALSPRGERRPWDWNKFRSHREPSILISIDYAQGESDDGPQTDSSAEVVA